MRRAPILPNPLLRTVRLASFAAGAAHAPPPAPRLDGMGPYAHATGSPSQLARRDFDRGMARARGCDAAAAARAFQAAAREDSKSGICLGGFGWSLGPTVNADMHKADAGRVRTALGRAEALSAYGAPRRRAMIAARGARHSKAGVLDEERCAAGTRAAA